MPKTVWFRGCIDEELGARLATPEEIAVVVVRANGQFAHYKVWKLPNLGISADMNVT